MEINPEEDVMETLLFFVAMYIVIMATTEWGLLAVVGPSFSFLGWR